MYAPTTKTQKRKANAYRFPNFKENTTDLEDTIDNIATNSSSSSENCSVSELFAKLLAHFSAFSWLTLHWVVGHLHRRNGAAER